MSLRTGERISSNKWEQLPISADVIDRVHELSEKEKRPLMKNKEIVFNGMKGYQLNYHHPHVMTNKVMQMGR